MHVLQDSLKKVKDTIERRKIEKEIQGLNSALSYIPASENEDSLGNNNRKANSVLPFGKEVPKSKKEYDSLQQKTSRERKRQLARKALKVSCNLY